MSKNIKIKGLKKLQKSIDQLSAFEVIPIECPSCGHKFDAKIGENVCPQCGQIVVRPK